MPWRTGTGSPEIWLFFKEIEPALRQDPGEQLQKGLLFRQRCEAEKKIFFKQFTTTEDWTRIFRQHLSRYVVRFTGGPTSEPIGEGFGGSLQTEAKPSGSTTGGQAAPSLLPLADTFDRSRKNGVIVRPSERRPGIRTSPGSGSRHS